MESWYFHMCHIPNTFIQACTQTHTSMERNKYSIYIYILIRSVKFCIIVQKDNTDWEGVQVLVHQSVIFSCNNKVQLWKTWIIKKGLIRRLWSDSQTKGVSAKLSQQRAPGIQVARTSLGFCQVPLGMDGL